MKIKIIAALTIICLSCNQSEQTAEKKEAEMPAPMAMDMHGYKVNYSNSFEIGDSKHCEAILTLYKEWDDGTLTANDIFADTFEISLANGFAMRGPKDSMMIGAQADRNKYSAVKSSIHTIFPVRSTDKDENWVCVWSQEIHTEKATGKTDSVEIQEAWRFNKDGKVNWLLQYDRPGAPPTK